MKFYHVLTTLSAFIIFTGCASKSVNFYSSIHGPDEGNVVAKQSKSIEHSGVVKIYIDNRGSIYPEDKDIVKFKPSDENLSEEGHNRLYRQFVLNKELCKMYTDMSTSDLSLLCDATKDTDNHFNPMSNKKWLDAQTKLWKKKAKEIYREASKDNRDILFMIHGFNNTYSASSKSFNKLEEEITSMKKHKGKVPLFVRVYWNGYEGAPFLTTSWGQAQVSGPLAGFNMRQLFKGIQTEYKHHKRKPTIMILTHSSGAFVAGSLLGNPYAALPKLYDENRTEFPEYDEFRDNRGVGSKKYPIPSFTKIRLGMIAAATPSTTFIGYYPKDINITGGLLSKNTELIFTMNKKDWVLGKFFNMANVSMLGATGSGQNEHLYCTELLNVKCMPTKAYDLSEGGILFWNGHGVAAYLDRTNIENFLKALLGEDVDDDRVEICK